jgi:hypothetical protein
MTGWAVNQSQFQPHLFEGAQRIFQIVAGVGCSDESASPRLGVGHRRISDALREHSLLEKLVVQGYRQLAFAGKYRRDWALVRPRVETETHQAVLEERGIVAERLHQLRLVVQRQAMAGFLAQQLGDLPPEVLDDIALGEVVTGHPASRFLC